jgi:hypothetical protein
LLQQRTARTQSFSKLRPIYLRLEHLYTWLDTMCKAAEMQKTDRSVPEGYAAGPEAGSAVIRPPLLLHGGSLYPLKDRVYTMSIIATLQPERILFRCLEGFRCLSYRILRFTVFRNSPSWRPLPGNLNRSILPMYVFGHRLGRNHVPAHVNDRPASLKASKMFCHLNWIAGTRTSRRGAKATSNPRRVFKTVLHSNNSVCRTLMHPAPPSPRIRKQGRDSDSILGMKLVEVKLCE